MGDGTFTEERTHSLLGHINQLAVRAVANGRRVMNVLRACSVNAIKHYGLEVGLLQVGDPADFVLVNDLKDFEVVETYIDGVCVARDGNCLIPDVPTETINQFSAKPISANDLSIVAKSNRIRIIEAIDGQLITRSVHDDANIENGFAVVDPERINRKPPDFFNQQQLALE